MSCVRPFPEKAEIKNDWCLKERVDSIHLRFYDIDDMETLREKLIQDFAQSMMYVYACNHPLITTGEKTFGFYEEIKYIINKRFGYEKDEK